MKKTFTILAVLAAFCSCDNEPVDYGKLTLIADKTEVEASGNDYVTFQLLDADGNDLLADRNSLQSVNIVSEEGPRVPRLENKTSFIANGEYNFTATYKGQQSENSVKVVARNRGKYETFHKNVAIYKATALGCAPCAAMTRALENLNEDAESHSVELCWHYGPQIGGIEDWYAIQMPAFSYDCGVMVVNHFNGAGVPTVGLDLIKPVTEKSSSAIENAIWNLRAEYPATCGIRLEARYDGGSKKIGIVSELKSSSGGEYDLGLAVLLNDQIEPQGTNEGGRYTHIVRAATQNFLMYSTSIKKVDKDGTMSFIQEIPWSESTENLSVVAFALVKHGNGARIDNIVEVKLGESIDYIYNE